MSVWEQSRNKKMCVTVEHVYVRESDIPCTSTAHGDAMQRQTCYQECSRVTILKRRRLTVLVLFGPDEGEHRKQLIVFCLLVGSPLK